ncbi:MAG: Ig-like domain-containing protein [Prevotella sp.]|nr:Ig-like domain-containing protein [Prevotella sp.]
MRKLIALTTITLLLLSSCAKMGQPDGGWYDETPPAVIGAIPQERSTGVDAKKITIYFNEYIKLDNPTEKVVVSPPQMEAPTIKGLGRYITVELNDTLKPNTTYTVDFSDAISDNNEGNPLGNYTYNFSTGDAIDTLEVAGNVVDAENMEPIKGILVGLYNNLSDTAFTTTPMLRVARTDSQGRFVVRGVAPGEYRIYALQDADGNYMFSQKSEKIAFSHEIVVPSCKPDVRQDTIWRDSLHIDNIIQSGYTHFLPDDIVLRAFNETQTDRFLVKTERKQANCFSLFFSYGNEELPQIKGLNFDEEDAFLLEVSERHDTLTYWIKDTLLVNTDTLRMQLTFLATDTTGVLQSKNDTLEMLSKEPYAKRMKEKEKEWEKWNKAQEKAKKRGEEYLTEMPPTPLDLKVQIQSDMMPDGCVTLTSPTPIAVIDTSKITLSVKQDTLLIPRSYVLKEKTVEVEGMESAKRTYILLSDSTDNLWTEGSQYQLTIDSAAFVDIYGYASAPTKKGMKVRTEDDFTTITMHVSKVDEAPYVGQLIDSKESVLRQVSSITGDMVFNYVKPGDYYLRVFSDFNNNGKWDTGDYEADLQAETMYYYPEKIECKAHWPVEKNWHPGMEKRLLKPEALTKQKAEKQKKIKNQNAERARKLGIIYIPKNY